MFSNLQISRTLAKKIVRMDNTSKTVSKEAMQAEWQEIQAAQREPRMFKPLYNRYFDAIFRFIYRRTNDEQLASDLCSQVFLKAMQRINKYQFKGVPFSAWLYRIASNEVSQYYRESQKNRVVNADDANLTELIDEIYDEDREHYKKAMIKALDQLKIDDMRLIELRFFEQRPFKEIANILGLTESNAKVKTYRILEKMKKII